MKIPLFDIDGVLLKTNDPVHSDSFKHAFIEVYGIHATKDDAGVPEVRINKQIIFENMKFHGLGEKEIMGKIDLALKAQADYVMKHKSELHPIVLPGVKNLLIALKEMNSPITVLTGNNEQIAFTRLEVAGLWDFFDFGAFGDEAMKRVELVEITRKKAEKFLKRKVDKHELVIIGDTPRDIACARDAGIEVIAVSTGIFSFEDLEKDRPDLLVHTLEEKDKILKFLGN